MACPSRETLSAVVVGLVLLGVLVCIPVLLIDGLAIIHRISVRVEDVSLDTFSITTLTPMVNSTSPPTSTTMKAPAAVVTITYNLSMTIRVHNPNWFLDVHFVSPLEVQYSFDGAHFVYFHVLLTSEGEKLPAGITRVYSPTTGVVGLTLPLGVDGVADLARQSSAGVFEVHMVVLGNYTVHGAKRSIADTCALKLPLAGTPPASSKKVKCM